MGVSRPDKGPWMQSQYAAYFTWLGLASYHLPRIEQRIADMSIRLLWRGSDDTLHSHDFGPGEVPGVTADTEDSRLLRVRILMTTC